MDVLRHFHTLTLAGKVLVYEYYRGLNHMTDNTEVDLPKYASQKDISSCSGFQTLAHAESKCNKGLQAMGIGICVCARHEMVLPLVAEDLQVGERYCNMDYVAGSASKAYEDCEEIFMSYDITCQWKAKLWDHMRKLPAKAQFHDDMALDFGVPKLHCRVHKYTCQCQFSMNLKPGVGRTDGEGVERTWDDMNPCASLMKEMVICRLHVHT
ncbi:uncharacterized protein ARMOST_20337 [Armillaria ostoyae]|uniref:Uncharacterized protein n=1 Tax=Armillaria ostoyae TaxID=47428 RepID=A0A284S728_ARMOS|nr:uncharacterized protein ARMOST_20337 [Armillaria ostoyae]